MTRRGYVAGALGAVVLVLTAITVVPRVLDREDDAVPMTSADDHYRIDGQLTCTTEVHDVPTLPLEAEPVALLVCADPDSSLPWTAPAELVEGDLAELVDRLSSLAPAPDGDVACTMQGGPAYDLVLRFSRGRAAKVHGDTGTCGFVTTAAGRWLGASDVLDTALALVERERAGRTPPTSASRTADLSCDAVLVPPGPARSLTGEAADIVRMVSCWQPDAPELGQLSETVVPAGDVRVLTRDLARRSSTSADPHDLRCPGGLRRLYFQTLVGQTSWGDLVVVPGECRRFYPALPSDRTAPVWHPSPRAQGILDRLRR
ncbi:hypothetical protein ASC64_15220 [Nocardioides sp. Root122]|uniref:hypothetical protein n=1 Tax=Nocardioides TaxID=1839 RepID=UPI0007031A13|nr:MULTISPECIES: hypothetical protein [Nocardioides]KQV65040.1 hypothetical protein ASC64_15220 [Nocardioides sp. Root122]MCK9823381.1 hypothetical protein [Nocardioides cavernae]